MTKKKTPKRGWGFSYSTKSLPEYLKQFHQYVINKQWSKAKQKLEELEHKFPSHKQVFNAWLILTSEQGDWTTYQKKAEEFTLKHPDEPDGYLSLASICVENNYPLLALQVLQNFCEKFPNHPGMSEVNQTISDIQALVPELLKDIGVEGQQALEIGTLTEKGNFLFETAQYIEARQLFENLLQLSPNLSPVLNNLSLILCFQGDLTQAITLAKKVLDKDQNNFQALGNLVHFYVLSGETELAEKQLTQLKELKNEFKEIWLKKAEALSWVGDNSALIELGKEAESSKVSEDLTASFWHCIAVAHANSGQTTKARQLWQKSLIISPDFESAKENLENLKLPVVERSNSWFFEMGTLIPFIVIEDIERMIKTDVNDEKKEESIAKQIIKNYPQIIHLIPFLLKFGSPSAREFALHISTLTKIPELILALKEFAFGKLGTDNQRLEVAQKLNQKGFIPSGPIKIWFKGKQQELLLMGIEINDAPTVIHSKKVQNLAQNGVAALRRGEGKKAESIFLEALELEPSAPDLKFNLVGAYQLQEREEEMMELLKKIHEEHPNYAFATIFRANHHLENQDLDLADELLKPLLERQNFNYMEFSKFCEVQIKLAMKKKNPDAARSWLEVWKQIGDEDDSALNYWCNRLEKKSSWLLK